jgi:hypothetical protein
MADGDVHRVKLQARTVEELRAFLDGSNLDFACRPAARQEAGGPTVEIYATLPEVERLRRARQGTGVSLSIVENASEIGRDRQAEVGSGNRFAGSRIPRGLGIKE